MPLGITAMNILVVDDEADAIETLSRGLRTKGHEVSEALSADEALKILENRRSKINMVITDYLMPKMNGNELLKEIRSRYDALPVILVTAYGSNKVLTEALHNGCNGFIEKPFTLEQLSGEIERISARA